ncbi:MAG: hypothetical protein ABIY51_08590 [Ferruginibacter sp.]
MKKISMLILCITAMNLSIFAQQKQTPATPSATKTKVVTISNHGTAVKAVATAPKVVTTKNHGTVVKAVASAPKKADGTADMRYKVNKAKVKTTGPLKADGTKDMRYKANKKS